ncbi:MAG: GDP-mannose 4,6-dehydratase [Gemmatimonadales bacterium]|nr:GDP-mannose 4,6-dehydratase [Gemmatimonadales bacterium]
MNSNSANPVLSGPCNLVTGALGFVGLHLVRSLALAGLPVVGVGRHGPDQPLPARAGEFQLAGPSTDLPDAVRYTGPSGDFIYLPMALENPRPVADLVNRLRPSMVFHLAAQSSAAVSFRDPADTFTSNVSGTLNLLEAVRRVPETERPVMLSVGSAEEYGPQPNVGKPIREDAPLYPISPYGVSKAAQTMLCRQYAATWDLPIILVRSFSHTGPGQDSRFAFPSFARQIAAAEVGKGPSEISVGDLSAARDFLDVRDVVDAYRLLLKEGHPGEIYNVCSGSSLTIRQGLEMLLDEATVEINLKTDPDLCRPSDIPFLVGDNTKIKRDSAWEPQYELKQTLSGVLSTSRKEFS